jgi:phosphate butyryltransferase
VEGKKKILANAALVARSLGIPAPKIALLAPVEKVSSRIQSTVDAAELKKWVNSGGLGDAIADGPFALDVAASAEAAAVKGIQSDVAGMADIYLAPNLDAGNILYKALTVFARFSSAGILAGARVPVVLTSRSDTEEVKIASLGLARNVAESRHRR